MAKKKFLVMIIILSIIALAAIAVAVFVVFKYVINEPERPANNPVDTASITQNANLSNWGFACDIDGDMYYSDHKTGIYIATEAGDELFVEGRYSDLCDLGDNLICVEYVEYYLKQDEKTIYAAQLAMIDLASGKKKILFNPPNKEDQLILLHKVNNKVYFSLSADMLYTVDQFGKVAYTGIRNVKKVTNSGIYTDKYSEKGLRLLSFENEEIRTYDSLDKYEVGVNFETDRYISLQLTVDDGSTWDFVQMDVNTGNFKSLPYQKEYGILRCINYYDGQLYMTFYNEGKCYVCKTSETGSRLTLLTAFNSTGMWPDYISIADGRIYVSSPFSDNEPKIMTLP